MKSSGDLGERNVNRGGNGSKNKADDDANVAQREIQDVYSGFNTRRAVDSALADNADGAQDMDDDGLADGMAGLRFGEEGWKCCRET